MHGDCLCAGGDNRFTRQPQPRLVPLGCKLLCVALLNSSALLPTSGLGIPRCSAPTLKIGAATNVTDSCEATLSKVPGVSALYAEFVRRWPGKSRYATRVWGKTLLTRPLRNG